MSEFEEAARNLDAARKQYEEAYRLLMSAQQAYHRTADTTAREALREFLAEIVKCQTAGNSPRVVLHFDAFDNALEAAGLKYDYGSACLTDAVTGERIARHGVDD